MAKFSLFSQSLRYDVTERYDRYLKSRLQMKAMLICSLLDIASLEITNTILERCGVLRGAYYIQGAILYQSSEGIWRTIHPRWDEELLSMLYNEENRAILLDRIECLQEAIDSILDLGDERITESVIGTLYGLCAKHDPSVPVHQFSIQAAVPIDIVHRVIKIPEFQTCTIWLDLPIIN
jgi:hypothetical protein